MVVGKNVPQALTDQFPYLALCLDGRGLIVSDHLLTRWFRFGGPVLVAPRPGLQIAMELQAFLIHLLRRRMKRRHERRLFPACGRNVVQDILSCKPLGKQVSKDCLAFGVGIALCCVLVHNPSALGGHRARSRYSVPRCSVSVNGDTVALSTLQGSLPLDGGQGGGEGGGTDRTGYSSSSQQHLDFLPRRLSEKDSAGRVGPSLRWVSREAIMSAPG